VIVLLYIWIIIQLWLLIQGRSSLLHNPIHFNFCIFQVTHSYKVKSIQCECIKVVGAIWFPVLAVATQNPPPREFLIITEAVRKGLRVCFRHVSGEPVIVKPEVCERISHGLVVYATCIVLMESTLSRDSCLIDFSIMVEIQEEVPISIPACSVWEISIWHSNQSIFIVRMVGSRILRVVVVLVCYLS
jgi:hypothetical protein